MLHGSVKFHGILCICLEVARTRKKAFDFDLSYDAFVYEVSWNYLHPLISCGSDNEKAYFNFDIY